MKILIISLAAFEERRIHSLNLMKKWDIKDFEIIEAIDGVNFDLKSSPEYSEKKAIASIGRPLSNVEIACSLSHKKAYRYIIENQISKALIIEDDVLFMDGIKDFLDKIELMDFYDILFPGYITVDRTVLRSIWNNRTISGKKIAPIVDKPYGTQGYIVNQFAASVLNNKSMPVFLPADHTTSLYKKFGLRGFGVFPPLIVQNDMPSISSTEENRMLRAEEPKERNTFKRRLSKLIKPLIFFK